MTHYREQLEAGAFDPPGGHAPAPASDAGDGFDGLTVEELKARAQAAGLPVSGTKAELVARLRGE